MEDIVKKSFLAALPLSLLSSLCMAQPSDDDILLMAASQKAVEIYRDSGVAGMAAAVDECASGLSRASAPEDVEFCVALNLATMHVDDLSTKSQGLPRDKNFTDSYVFSQAEELLKFFAPTEHRGQLTPYLQERSAKTAGYVARAANASQPNRPAENETTNVQAVAEAFVSFWQSTDCGEMRSLSQWDELIATLRTNDQQLCATFVQMHQQVQGVQVDSVKLLSDSRARVSATLKLRQQVMQQHDTFVLVNGKWLLAGKSN